MSLVDVLGRMWLRLQLFRLKRQGLVIADDCRIEALPSFGSEPYLISIGRHVAMSAEVALITHDGATYVFRDQPGYEKVIKYGRITILDNCVIGYRATILPGVVIGPNSVVSAGSVVTRNVPPHTVVAGNPAAPVMTVEQYAQWALAVTPQYDPEEYRRNKRGVLEKLALRGSPRPPQVTAAPAQSDPTASAAVPESRRAK